MQLEEKKPYPVEVFGESPDSSEVSIKIIYEMGCRRIECVTAVRIPSSVRTPARI